MKLDIGIDLGSTYSTVSKYNPAIRNSEPMTTAEGAPASIPSEVAYNEWEMSYSCGTTAKNMAGQSGVQLFRAFKMLLVESNSDILEKHGYRGANTPRSITTKFLASTLKSLVRREEQLIGNHTKIDTLRNIVICMPELWANELSSQDGRGLLREILMNDIRKECKLKVENVRVVTEPEAASAYIAHSYEAETSKPFNGHLLLIDYGGGTLDLTLTEVESDGNGSMQITYKDSGGAGQNHLDEHGVCKIGKAGIAYIQNVLQRAMADAGLLQPGQAPDYSSTDFKVSYNRLEEALKNAEKMDAIEEIFSQYGPYRDFRNILTDELENPLFAAFPYGSNRDVILRITYPHLFLAYQEVVEGALWEEVDKINQSVRKIIGEDPCLPAAGTKDNFKIALVGGFSSFYLVKQQIAEIYNFNTNAKLDKRTKGISASSRELAISMGAALLAAKKVVLKQTARYSIGIASELISRSSNEEYYHNLCYGIHYHQTIEPGKIYYIHKHKNRADDPEDRVVYGSLPKNLTRFVIEFSPLDDEGDLMSLKPEMRKRLQRLPEENAWYVGFSMDENAVISLHVTPRTILGAPTPAVPDPIRLESYGNLFALTAVKRVKIK